MKRNSLSNLEKILQKKSSHVKFNNIFPSVKENLKLKRTDFSGDPKKISQYIKSEMKIQ